MAIRNMTIIKAPANAQLWIIRGMQAGHTGHQPPPAFRGKAARNQGFLIIQRIIKNMMQQAAGVAFSLMRRGGNKS